MKHKTRQSHLSINTVLSILLLIVFMVLLTFSVTLVRTKILQNAYSLGMSLAYSYATEEEGTLNFFRGFLELGGQYLEEMVEEGESTDEIHNWLCGYFEKMTKIVGDNVIDPYAVIDGQIVAANPWEGDDDYDYAATDWYQQAVAADGTMIFTDVYQDVITGTNVITAAKKLDGGELLVMDIYLRNLHSSINAGSLPEGSSAYLCDSTGALIYSNTGWDVSDETLAQYSSQLMQGIQNGSVTSYDSFFEDPTGTQRGTYYAKMSNGWTVILTVPSNVLLMGDRSLTVYLLGGIACTLFVILAGMVVRDLFQNRRIRRAGNTIQILGDSFYAVYRVNYTSGVYEAIKQSQDMQQVLPPRAEYGKLLQTVRSLVEPSTYEEFERSFSLQSIRQRVKQGVADYGGDYQRRFGDEYRWVNIRTLYNQQLDPDEVILCFREVDLEKRRQLQQTILLQEALDTARRSTKEKSAFFSNMSHDMRTPLNAIIGFSGLAQKNRDDQDKVDDYMKKIEFAGKQLLALINDILELSRLEYGGNRLQNTAFDLRRCVEENAEIFRLRAAEEHKSLAVEIHAKNTMVLGDAQRLGQILTNLISNAFKYSDPGASVAVRVEEFEFEQHSKYQFVIEDTGIGMSPGFLEHLFEPYARETRFSANSPTGTGLGMPIVKSLVQQMSGEISVESELGKGSRFTVVLPLTVVREPLPAKKEKSAKAGEEFQLAGRRILLAEDNELNMEIATELLTGCGVEVVQAYNGLQALHLFQAAAPYAFDAILMDMQMPEMDGCQAASEIRALERPDAASVPIIAVTANAFAEDIAKTTAAGMNGHIAKPIDFKLLTQKLSELIGKENAAQSGHPAEENE